MMRTVVYFDNNQCRKKPTAVRVSLIWQQACSADAFDPQVPSGVLFSVAVDGDGQLEKIHEL